MNSPFPHSSRVDSSIYSLRICMCLTFYIHYFNYFLLAMPQILTEEQIKEIEHTARTNECATDPAQFFFGDEPLLVNSFSRPGIFP